MVSVLFLHETTISIVSAKHGTHFFRPRARKNMNFLVQTVWSDTLDSVMASASSDTVAMFVWFTLGRRPEPRQKQL